MTLSGPSSSPAWGVESKPASRAMANASANLSGGPPVSSLSRPNETTPAPANFTAALADSVAFAGSAVRSQATMNPTPMPVAREASSPALTMISITASTLPKVATCTWGSNDGSTQMAPSLAASSTTS